MKYFDIDESVRYHSFSELTEKSGFSKMLNIAEKMAVLSEQLRQIGMQPFSYMDGSGFEIQPACKKFMKRERRYKGPLSKRAMEYMRYVEGEIL